MMKLEKFDGLKTYATPIGGIQTPEYLLEKFPALALGATYLIMTDDEGFVALSEPMSLAQLRTHYAIDQELNEDDAIAALEAIENAPQPEPEPTAEERIAAAMEFQNALTLADLGLAVEPAIVAKNWERGLWSADMAVLAAGEEAVAMGIVDEAQYNVAAVKLGKAEIVEVEKQA